MNFEWRKILFDPLAWLLSCIELRKLMDECGDDPLLVYEASKKYVGRGFYASIRSVQEDEEIISFARKVQSYKPKIIVEIGTRKGGTLFLWCRTNPQVETVVSIDLPNGRYGGGYRSCRKKFYQNFIWRCLGAKIIFFHQDSHDLQTVEHLRKALNGRQIDFLFIDGDHTYSGVKQDYENFKNFVRPGGLIAFHDIVTRTQECGVYQLWQELIKKSKSMEFIGAGSHKGIGVLFV